MKCTKYEVVFEPFTDRHFIKTFAKKYKGAWNNTWDSLMTEFTFFDSLFLKSGAQMIVDATEIKIYKTEFKISGSNNSRHGSGNRCIVAVHHDTCQVKVLLVYHKNDLPGQNETAAWKQKIKDNYPAYMNLL
mgnify:CR=1 FL=1